VEKIFVKKKKEKEKKREIKTKKKLTKQRVPQSMSAC